MGTSRPTEVDRRFPPEPAAAEAARREMETLGWAVDAEEANVLALLVTELVANSIQHAGCDGAETVRLEAQVTYDTVRVSVTDGGDGFVAPFRTEASPDDSHWGLHLLDALADRWEISGSPTTVVAFELDRGTRAPDERPDDTALGHALAEQARLGDAYGRAVGTSSEMASYERLRAAGREVVAIEAALQRTGP